MANIDCVFILLSRHLGLILVLGADIWSCLCWVDVLFLGFWYPLWLLGGCDSHVLPGKEFFWDLDRFGHWRFRATCFSGLGPDT